MNKSEIPDDQEMEVTAELLRAMAHPLRLKLLAVLATAGVSVCACDLEIQLSVNQPTVAHHLRILRKAGAVHARKSGTWVYYSINEGMITLLYAVHRLHDGSNGRWPTRPASSNGRSSRSPSG